MRHGCGHEEDENTSKVYLGAHTDSKLDFIKNTEALYKKGQNHLLEHLLDGAQDVLYV